MGHEDQLVDMIDPRRIERMERVLDGRLRGLTVLLEDVNKPQNMGACIRTVEALGLLDVHVVERSAPFEPNSSVTQGCHKWVRVHRHGSVGEAVATLRGQGFRILATHLEATRTLDEIDLSQPSVLCFGNELVGMTDDLVRGADETFHVPMFGFTQSFNLSVAVGICVNTAAAARRRQIGAASDLTAAQRQELRAQWIPLLRKGSEQILDALAQREPGE